MDQASLVNDKPKEEAYEEILYLLLAQTPTDDQPRIYAENIERARKRGRDLGHEDEDSNGMELFDKVILKFGHIPRLPDDFEDYEEYGEEQSAVRGRLLYIQVAFPDWFL